jgi:hypothetical protein
MSARFLTFVAGARVRHSRRPTAHAVSPDRLTGVDCAMPTVLGAGPRGIGTVVSRAALTGGHVLQGSAYAQVRRSGTDRRLPWSYYLACPGIVETIGKTRSDELANGFVTNRLTSSVLDLGAIGNRAIEAVHGVTGLDFKPPFRAARTTVRWAATLEPDRPRQIAFSVESDSMRTVRVSTPDADVAQVVALCEDLALHDWLLTTLLYLIERSRIGVGPADASVAALRPAVEHLLHLWMPGATVAPALRPLWEALEREAGFTRQWNASVQRIRDHLAVSTLAAMSQPTREGADMSERERVNRGRGAGEPHGGVERSGAPA